MVGRHRRLGALALVLGAIISAPGCSAPATEQPPPTTEVGEEPVDAIASEVEEEPRAYPAGADYFFVASDGAVGKFTFPGEPYAPAEEMRTIVGAPPVTYVTVVVDNRRGTAGVNMYELAAFDSAGRKYTFSTIDIFLDEWSQSVGTSTDDDVELYTRFVDTINANTIYADVGQVAKFVMASPDIELPSEFMRIAVQPSGMGTEVEVLPTTEAADVDLTFEPPR